MERIEKLKNLLVAQPKDCFLLHALGLEYSKLGELETAISYFKLVLESDEKYVGTYYHLAKTYELKQNIHEAINIYNKGIAIAVNLKDNHARNELQMALEDIED